MGFLSRRAMLDAALCCTDTVCKTAAELFGPYTWAVLCRAYPESRGGDKTSPRAG